MKNRHLEDAPNVAQSGRRQTLNFTGRLWISHGHGQGGRHNNEMICRDHCAACCIAPSISSPIPGMPVINGISKPAGVRCIQLAADDRCQIFGMPERPAVCGSLRPSATMCGESRGQAMHWLGWLERETTP